MKKLLFLSIATSMLFTACKKEETPDTQKPVITVTSPASDHLDKEPGDTLNLAALLTDNVALLNAKIDIHKAGDHGHKITGEGWEWAKVYVISGTEHSLTESIVIPADAELGDYHITFEATDKAGNAATPVVVDLHID
ncbi:MAG: DUF4625 domain-containing protein [Sphingobacteriaceae bacterium]|nr:DUF4625 domain-containing protein [Sphingobacteriaceae bacterium]